VIDSDISTGSQGEYSVVIYSADGSCGSIIAFAEDFDANGRILPNRLPHARADILFVIRGLSVEAASTIFARDIILGAPGAAAVRAELLALLDPQEKSPAGSPQSR
jgi:hypothetical protein